MDPPKLTGTRQRTEVIGRALLNPAIPATIDFLRAVPVGRFADPAHLRDDRKPNVVTAVAIACAVGMLARAPTQTASVFSRLSMSFVNLGVLLSAYLLVAQSGRWEYRFFGECVLRENNRD